MIMVIICYIKELVSLSYERNKMDKKIYLDNAATTRPYLEAI